MKKISLSLVGFLLAIAFLFSPFVHAQSFGLTEEEDVGLGTALNTIVAAIQQGDANAIITRMKEDVSSEIKAAIQEAVGGKKIDYYMEISSVNKIPPNVYEIEGKFAAEGENWSVDGLSNRFVFEKVGDKYLLTETNFHEKLGVTAALKVIGLIFLIFSPLFLFWLWMLVDAAKRPLENKTMWIILLVLFNIIAAVIYFFTARRRAKKMETSSHQIHN